jgi:N-acetylmuramoyl-L-alanine amidase
MAMHSLDVQPELIPRRDPSPRQRCRLRALLPPCEAEETTCLARGLQHNGKVLFRAIASIILPALLLGGCASPSYHNFSQAPAWEEPNTTVSDSPVFPVAGPVNVAPPPQVKLPEPTTAPVIQTVEGWVPLQRWSRANNVGTLAFLAAAPLPTYALQSTNGTFILHAGSQLAQWDGLEVRLGFAPQLIDGQPFAHSLDLNKTIQPLLQGEVTWAPGSSPVIVIDPGHGGENGGTKSVLGNHYEKEFTLDWALRVQSVLAANHCRSFLTRSNDTDLAISNRVAFAAEHKADVFLSLHFNSAAPNEVESGLETYCLTPVGMPSNLTRGFPDEIRQSFPNNSFDRQNLFLALRVHRALLQVNGHHDRGIRRARFLSVLRGQQRAAILVEGGYLSNPQEARRIGDPAYRQRLAEAVAKALLPRVNAAGPIALLAPSGDSELTHVSAPIGDRGTNTQARAASILGENAAKPEASDVPEDRAQSP